MRACFIHVPKVAGTSIIHVMKERFGYSNVFHVVENRFWAVPIGHLLRRYRIIAGHFSIRYLSDLDLQEAFVFTFLRDPVDRLLSQYAYFRSLSEEIKNPEVTAARLYDLKQLMQTYGMSNRFSPWANWQTKIFSGCDPNQSADEESLQRAKHNLEQLAFVGVYEEIGQGVRELLQAWKGSDLHELPILNRTAGRTASSVIDEETCGLIQERNWLDRELYQHAQRLWRSRHTPAAKPELKTDLVGMTEYGSREIEIIRLGIEGDHGESYQIRQGEPWAIFIEMESKIEEEDLTVGVKISDAIGLSLYGTNSFLCGQRLSIGKGRFRAVVRFSPMSLAPGRYTLTSALHTSFTADQKCYHWIENALEVDVLPASETNFTGVIDLGASFPAIEPGI
jgi:hypothetical protein